MDRWSRASFVVQVLLSLYSYEPILDKSKIMAWWKAKEAPPPTLLLLKNQFIHLILFLAIPDQQEPKILCNIFLIPLSYCSESTSDINEVYKKQIQDIAPILVTCQTSARAPGGTFHSNGAIAPLVNVVIICKY